MILLLLLNLNLFAAELPKPLDICLLSYPNMPQSLIDYQAVHCQ
jgi:hypothetical protein